MDDYLTRVARRACVAAGEAPADGPWALDDFFEANVGRTVRGEHVAVFEAAVRVRQSQAERTGPRERLVEVIDTVEQRLTRAVETMEQNGRDLERYLRHAEVFDNVATPEGRTVLAFGDEKCVPGGTELAADARKFQELVKGAAELAPRLRRRLDERRPDILRAKMLTDSKSGRAAMISALTDMGMGPSQIAKVLGDAPAAPPRGRDRKASQERRSAADAVTDVLRSIRRKLRRK